MGSQLHRNGNGSGRPILDSSAIDSVSEQDLCLGGFVSRQNFCLGRICVRAGEPSLGQKTA